MDDVRMKLEQNLEDYINRKIKVNFKSKPYKAVWPWIYRDIKLEMSSGLTVDESIAIVFKYYFNEEKQS
jgi:hypothetical protein